MEQSPQQIVNNRLEGSLFTVQSANYPGNNVGTRLRTSSPHDALCHILNEKLHLVCVCHGEGGMKSVAMPLDYK